VDERSPPATPPRGPLAGGGASGAAGLGGQRPFLLGGRLVVVGRIELRAVILLQALDHRHGAVAVLSDRVDGPGVVAGYRGRERPGGVAAAAPAPAPRWHEGHVTVPVLGAPYVRWTGLARLRIRLESMVTGRVHVELDVEEFRAVGRRGARTGPTEPAPAATFRLVLMPLAFGDCDGDREDGQSGEELLHRRQVAGVTRQNERLRRSELIGLRKRSVFRLM